jgi:hypothetical protein
MMPAMTRYRTTDGRTLGVDPRPDAHGMVA